MTRVLVSSIFLIVLWCSATCFPQYSGVGGNNDNNNEGEFWWQKDSTFTQNAGTGHSGQISGNPSSITPSQSNECPVGNDCVPWKICKNGIIDTSGSLLLNLRQGYEPVPKDVEYAHCGQTGNVCCRIPSEILDEQQGSQIGTIGSGIIGITGGISGSGSHQGSGHINQGSGHNNQGSGHINQGSGHNNQGSGHNNQGTSGQINQSGPPYPACSSGLTCVIAEQCNLYTGFLGEQIPTYENQPFVQYNLCTSEYVPEGVCCQAPPEGSGVVGVGGSGNIGVHGTGSGNIGVHGTGSGNIGAHGSGSGNIGVHGSGSGSTGPYGPGSGNTGGSGSGSSGIHGSGSGNQNIGTGSGLDSVVTVHPVCGIESDCVPYFQCNNEGYINVAGIGIIDIRTKPVQKNYEEKECKNPDHPDVPAICCRIPPEEGSTGPVVPEPPKIVVHDSCPGGTVCLDLHQCNTGYEFPSSIDSSVFNSKCHWDKSSGAQGVCCAPEPPKILPYGGCTGGSVCVEEHTCQSGTVNTDGTGLIDVRHLNKKCYYDETLTTVGVCCNPPLPPKPEPKYICPGNSVCTLEYLCPEKGTILNSQGNFIPWVNDASWQECDIEGGDGIFGICCQEAETKPPIIKPDPLTPKTACGERNVEYSNEIDTRIQSYNLEINEAKFGEFPWQAIIFFSNYTFQCGATLIDENFVLTAAHCVNKFQPYDLKVRLGEWAVSSFDEPRPYVDRNVVDILVHPDFKPGPVFNDIAILTLEKPVKLEYHINSICLPNPGYIFPEGTRCVATGWGKDSFEGRFQHKLKKIELPIVGDAHCQKLLKQTRLGKYFRLHDSFMCAGGEENKDACKGDGGGPLACLDPKTNRYVITGITAWGIGCGTKDVPGVYAEVQLFTNWITNHLDAYYNTGDNSPTQQVVGSYGKK